MGKNIIRLTEQDLHNIVKRTVNKLLENKKIDHWFWPKGGLSDRELDNCKENVYAYAKEKYGNSLDGIKELYKLTYADYLSKVTNLSGEKIEILTNKDFELLDRFGWALIAETDLPQGWWHYLNWLIENNKMG